MHEFLKFIWLTYLQPKIDYCSQLWGPPEGPNLKKLENLLRRFTAKINGFKNLTYWERLKRLHLSSIGRRIERYRIIYTWKILQNHSPNCGLTWKRDQYKGTLFDTIQVGKYSIGPRSASFQYLGPRLFNTLPKYLRNSSLSQEEFKFQLNQFLDDIPDTPVIGDLTPHLCNLHTNDPTNSLLYWVPHIGLSNLKTKYTGTISD